MIKLMVIVLLVVLGVCLGSFVNALVWRLHKQAASKAVASDSRYSITHGRSMCPHCEHELSAKDLVPVLSWLSLRGKCRYCQKPIPDTPLPELIVPALIVWSYLAWPYASGTWQLLDIAVFAVWVLLLTGFTALALYDFRWQILPDKMVAPLTVLGAALVVCLAIAESDIQIAVGALLGAVVLFGIFYGLYAFSGGKWIGGGDVKLAVLLGLLAGGVAGAFMVLFIASFLGTAYIAAISLIKRRAVSRQTRIPFGPFLLLAAVVIALHGVDLFDWYTNLLLPA